MKNLPNKKPKKEESLHVEYMNDHEFYKKKYGEKTIVLMQVGGFFECYSTETQGPDLLKISKLINVIRSKKDKTKEVSIEYPYMLGFPLQSLNKYITMLVNNNYTVIVKEQTGSKKANSTRETREITDIITPGTYVENIENHDGNYVCCIVLEEHKQRNGNILLSSGMSAIDISTGKLLFHEAISTDYDQMFALDETNRFMNTINVMNVLVYYNEIKKNPNTNNGVLGKNKIISYLELEKKEYSFKDNYNKEFENINFQMKFFNEIYENKSMLSILEELDIERMENGRLSLIILLDFINGLHPIKLKDIERPEKYINNEHLILGNNAIFQLNVTEDGIKKRLSSFESLFDVVNNTSTAVGFRYLKNKLTSPIVDHNKLNKIYQDTEIMIKNKLYEKIEQHLNMINDIERMYRKMVLNKLNPYELVNMLESCTEIINMYPTIMQKYNKSLKEIDIDKLQKFINTIENKCIVQMMKKYTILNIDDTFFVPGLHPEIDVIKNKLTNNQDIINNLCDVLIDYVDDGKNNFNGKKKITVNKGKDGYYLKLSKQRAEILKHNLEEIEMFQIKNMNIKPKNFIFDNSNKNDTKIHIPELKKQFINDTDDDDNDDNINDEEGEHKTDVRKLILLTQKYYSELLTELSNDYGETIKEVIPFIAYIDFLKSNAKTSIKYNYTKPIINYDKNKGYVVCKKMRHPIVERLIDYGYTPHDLEIGNDLKGILLYGLNSSGKSTIMKALGLCVIMAQSGLFVPAEYFVYSPYNALYTRINGNDDLIKGLSSFTVEMLELKAIMKRASPQTLIIGDEICRGTEHVSGNSIVAATVISLSKSNSSFVFATHLHEIGEMNRIKELNNVKSFHISVEEDKDGNLIYDRELKEGTGRPCYGVLVASHIIKDNSFIKLANEIKNELLNYFNGVITGIKSRYNSKVLLDKCSVCGEKNKTLHHSPLETHHISFQKNSINGFTGDKPHIKLNDPSNLVVLCSECHDKLHNDEFSIEGYVQTSQGRKLKINKKNTIHLENCY